MAEFCAITAVYNPGDYDSRFRLYEDFRRRIKQSGVPLYTVELTGAGQEFRVTDRNDPFNIQLHSEHAMWHKENLINIAIHKLPRHWDSVAWLDADILFGRPDWFSATKEKLKKHTFVQMFSHILDLGPNFEPVGVLEGFAYRYLNRDANPSGKRHRIGQPGCAWAARRDVLDALGGLIETSILGSNDYYMAQAMVGAVTPEMTSMPGSNYAKLFMDWQQKYQQLPNHNIGYVDTTVLHYWHGRKKDRGYNTRWRILVENQFDPVLDLKKNAEGVLEFTDRNPALCKAIRDYFRSRMEDNVDT